MTTLLQKPLSDKTQTDTTQEPEGCQLGRDLGNCPLKRKGCGTLYGALMHVMPPYHIRVMVRTQMQGDKAAQDWLRRLDDVLPEQRPTFTRRGW